MKIIYLLFCLFLLEAHALELKTSAQEGSGLKYSPENKSKPGLCIEIMNAVEKIDPEIKFKGKEFMVPLKRIEENLAVGETDIFFGFLKTPERLKKVGYSKVALFPVKTRMAVATDDSINVKNFDEIRRLGPEGVVSVVQGTAFEVYLKEQKDIIVDTGALDIQNNLRKLIAKRVRFHFNSNLNFEDVINTPEFKDKIKILPNVFTTEFQYVAFSKKVPEVIVTRINKDLEKLKSQGILEKITKKYLNDY